MCRTTGENLYRRVCIRFWKRSVFHHPALAIFDVRPQYSDTSRGRRPIPPLQGFWLLMNCTRPLWEASKVLGEQMQAYPEILKSIEENISEDYRRKNLTRKEA